jgi:uncharacterized protein YecT (DUF1311 family)
VKSDMRILPIIVLIIISVGLCACSPQKRNISAALASTPFTGDCYKTATTQSNLNECAAQTAEATYVQLKALLDELRDHMEAAQYQKILDVQSEWEKVAKEHCEWEADFFAGGSSQPMWIAGCLEQQYRQRIEALRFNLCEGHGATGTCEATLKYKAKLEK